MITLISSVPKKPILLSLTMILLSSSLWASFSDQDPAAEDELTVSSCPYGAGQRPLSARARQSLDHGSLEGENPFKNFSLTNVASFSTPAQIDHFLEFCNAAIMNAPQPHRRAAHVHVMEAFETVLTLLQREILSHDSAAGLPLPLHHLEINQLPEESEEDATPLSTSLPSATVQAIWSATPSLTANPSWPNSVELEEEKASLSHRPPAVTEEEESDQDPEDPWYASDGEEDESQKKDPAAVWAKEKIEHWGAWIVTGQKSAANQRGSAFSLLSQGSQGSEHSRDGSLALTEEQFKAVHAEIQEDVRQTFLKLAAKLPASLASQKSLSEALPKGLRSLHVSEV